MAHEHPRWIVLKFGGTSVSTAANWKTIAGVLRARLAQGYRPLVVHSALSGITQALDTLASQAITREHAKTLADIEALHRSLAADLGLDGAAAAALDTDVAELRELVEGVALVTELTPRTRARLLAFGERMATRLGAAYLGGAGVATTWLDARELLTSVDRGNGSEPGSYLSAECDPSAEPALAARLAQVEGVPVTQGFTARNAAGETVVLGRGGSDTAAAYFAGKLSAEHLEIWTDVPGMFTADPRVVPSARLLRQLDYREAQEIATTGSKVLHPRCIPALRDRGIPIRVHSTGMLHVEGTLIRRGAAEGPAQLKAISCKKSIVLVSMETVGMWQEVGFLAKAFAVIGRCGLSVDLVSTSETNVTVSLDTEANLLEARTLDRVEEELGRICRVTLIHNCAAVSLVGRRIRGLLHKLGPALQVFEQQRIHLLSQAASDLNLTVVVDEDQADRLVRLLHAQLVAQAGAPDVFGPSWEELQPDKAERPPRAVPWWERKRDALLAALGSDDAAYVYDLATIDERLAALRSFASVDRVLYSMKANPNPEILQRVRAAGAAFECVSPGEIQRVMEIFPGIAPTEILFTPNFAPRSEYRAALELGVHTTLDSIYPLRSWPQLFRGAEVFLRIDPGVGRGHHDKVRTAGQQAKFGVPLFELEDAAKIAALEGVRVVGLHAHSGSGILSPEHWAHLGQTLAEASRLFPEVGVLDVGGGLGVPEKPGQDPLDLGAVAAGLTQLKAANPGKSIWLEPGRFVVAESGVILARVTQIKGKGAVRYVGVATGMNALIRPALYGSYHEIVNLTRLGDEPTERANIVGPICETGDTLGFDRLLPPTAEGDVLLIANTGAYGFAMASRYNLREPPPQRYL
ncbi:MAG: bifunctional aspartate kinase/diaminopimelate decarboxylase [Gemmatimonadetes bacterium]|nr:bifunctional aspartate kinase/diaminopimelate decarboxylase [Gemmatimonadota bacterium]